MSRLRSALLACAFTVCATWGAVGSVHAHGDASTASAALSLLPLGSVVATASVAGAASTAAVALPLALSAGGVMLSVKAVEVAADGAVYLLERASDGAQVSVKVLRQGAQAASVPLGASVAVTVLGTGALISYAGEVLAYVPNAIGRALLHNERLL